MEEKKILKICSQELNKVAYCDTNLLNIINLKQFIYIKTSHGKGKEKQKNGYYKNRNKH